jgi:hypothetical protein
LIEEQFIELRNISRLLQDRMRLMNEESKEASGDKKYSGEKSVEPGVRSIEE